MSTTPKDTNVYHVLTIEAARTGWIVKESGRPAEVFVRWDTLVRYIESRLTTKEDL
jgi:hypothetical protein